MLDDQYQHLHQHFLCIQGQFEQLRERLDGLDRALQGLAQIEIINSLKELNSMAKQSEEISKLGDRFDALAAVVTDVQADFEAFREAMEAERDNLSDEGQAALDAATAKADAVAQKLADLDTKVGDADGSDVPEPAEPAEPAEDVLPVTDEAPPAGEGTVVNPDEQFDAGDGDARPTA